MQDDDENADERGALVLRPDSPRRGRFTGCGRDSPSLSGWAAPRTDPSMRY
jgi:hypothetical protein